MMTVPNVNGCSGTRRPGDRVLFAHESPILVVLSGPIGRWRAFYPVFVAK